MLSLCQVRVNCGTIVQNVCWSSLVTTGHGIEIWNERLEWVTEMIQFVLGLTELLNHIIRRPTKSPHLPGSSFDLSTGWMSSIYNGMTVTHCPRQWPTHCQDHTMHTKLPWNYQITKLSIAKTSLCKNNTRSCCNYEILEILNKYANYLFGRQN